MLWPRQHKEPKKVYVPIVNPDSRDYAVKWVDDNYLRTVAAFEHNTVFITEVLETLRQLREVADRAATNDVLKGCNVGIKAVKRLLTLPAQAKAQIQRLEVHADERN